MDQGAGEYISTYNKVLQFTLTLVPTNLMISLARLMEVELQMSLLMMNWKLVMLIRVILLVNKSGCK